jgi:hypothetical protein
MNTQAEDLTRVMRLVAQADCLFLVTADAGGTPSFIPVEDCRTNYEGDVVVRAWIDPAAAPAGFGPVGLLIWSTGLRQGYELTGVVEHSQRAAVLDGYAPIESQKHFEQVENELVIAVDAVTAVRAGVRDEARL